MAGSGMPLALEYRQPVHCGRTRGRWHGVAGRMGIRAWRARALSRRIAAGRIALRVDYSSEGAGRLITRPPVDTSAG